MMSRVSFLDIAGGGHQTAPVLPEGLRYSPELINSTQGEVLLERVHGLPFREFEFHGYTGKRRVVSFGWYDSEEYRELKALRLAATKGNAVFIEGNGFKR